MKNLLDRKAIMSTRLSRRGQSPISIALSSRKADTARILLDKVHVAISQSAYVNYYTSDTTITHTIHFLPLPVLSITHQHQYPFPS